MGGVYCLLEEIPEQNIFLQDTGTMQVVWTKTGSEDRNCEQRRGRTRRVNVTVLIRTEPSGPTDAVKTAGCFCFRGNRSRSSIKKAKRKECQAPPPWFQISHCRMGDVVSDRLEYFCSFTALCTESFLSEEMFVLTECCFYTSSSSSFL